MSEIDEFDLLEWIESGTVARRSVVIYNDPGVVAEFEDVQRRLAIAEQAAKDPEASVAEESEVAALRERLEALWQRWEDSKSVWTVQALSEEQARLVLESYPVPPAPVHPGADASDEEKAAHGARLREWAPLADAAREERNMAFIAAAVVKVETSRGVATSVSVEALRKMRARPHGKARTTELLKAVEAATEGDVEVPAPKSPSSSNGDRA